jgi:cell division septation protein DedD
MANQQKNKKSIHIEMSILGLLGLGLVAFIVLLWMFLLGIWAGQTILLPEEGGTGSLSNIAGMPPEGGAAPAPVARVPAAPAAQTPIPILIPDQDPDPVDLTPDQPATPELIPESIPLPNEEAMALPAAPDHVESSSFFSLQIAAFSEAESSYKEAAAWRQRGVEAFALRPEEGGDGLYRVCVGRFAELAEANREASRLEEAENIKPFITLIPAFKARQP